MTLLVLLLAAPCAVADEPLPPPLFVQPPTVAWPPVKRRYDHKGLLAGALLLGFGVGVAAVGAAVDRQAEYLIPVGGPFLSVGRLPPEGFMGVILMGCAGLAQAAGLITLGVGFRRVPYALTPNGWVRRHELPYGAGRGEGWWPRQQLPLIPTVPAPSPYDPLPAR